MIIFFIITKDFLAKAVEQETSHLAAIRRSEDGLEQIDDLVMDGDQEVLFKRLMNDAKAEVINNIGSNYLIDTPTDLEAVYTEFPDFRQDRDFNLWLNMHDDFLMQYRKSIEIKMQQYMIDYICYRWLEKRSPKDAQTYASRLVDTLTDIRQMLIRKRNPIKRKPSFP